MVGLVVGLETSEDMALIRLVTTTALAAMEMVLAAMVMVLVAMVLVRAAMVMVLAATVMVLVDMAMVLAVLADPEAGIAALMTRALSLLFQTPIDLTSN